DGDDVVHQIFHRLRADGTFLAGFPDAGQKFLARKLLPPPVALEHHQPFALNLLVSCEPMRAFGALAATANRGPLARGARINDPVVLTTALWAAHKATANCGHAFVTYKTWGCQGMAGRRLFTPWNTRVVPKASC